MLSGKIGAICDASAASLRSRDCALKLRGDQSVGCLFRQHWQSGGRVMGDIAWFDGSAVEAAFAG
jgi:hypothetical protein